MDVKRFFRKLTGTEEKPDFSVKTPYQILEVPKSAEPHEIKTAYFEKVKIYSPELHPDEFMVIRKAYESLKEPDSRAEADLKFLAHPVQQPGYSEIDSGALSLVKFNKEIEGLKSSEEDREALVQALKQRSLIHFEKQSWSDALKDWEQILEYDPEDDQTRDNIRLGKVHNAFSLAAQNKQSDALEAYEALLKEVSNDGQLLLNVAILADAAEGIDRSAPYWKKLQTQWKGQLSEAPEDEHLKNLIIQVQKRLAGHKAPVEQEVVTTVASSKGKSSLQLANSLIEQKQYSRAITLLESLIKQGQTEVDVYDSLGWALLHAGHIDKAFLTWRRAQREYTNHPTLKDSVTRAHFQLGKNMYEAGHYTPALTHLKQVLSGDPRNLEVYDLLAKIYLQRGDPHTAIDLWNKALRINPKSKQYQKAIRLAKLKTRK